MKRKVKLSLISLLLAFLCLTVPAHAYIDPATTTYVIQIVTALVITLGVTIGVFFTRVRLSIVGLYVRVSEFFIRLFSKKKGIAKTTSRNYDSKRPRTAVALSFGKRFVFALFVSVSFVFSFIVFGFYELYMLNADSFNFPYRVMVVPVLLLALVLTVLMCAFLTLLRGKAFETFLTLVFGVLLAGYIQGNFLNRGLGILSGDHIDWSTQAGPFLINTLIWIAIVSVPFAVKALNKKFWSVSVRAVSCLLVAVQLVSMIALKASSEAAPQRSDQYLSTKGMYEVAKNENILVFILDRLDNRYIESVIKSDPQFFDRLDGFTRFTNNMSLYSQTFPSVANMLTGKPFQFEQSKNDYLRDAWSSSTYLPTLRSHKYDIQLYMEPGFTFRDAEDLEQVADNIVENQVRVHTRDALVQFTRLSAFRYAPLFAKPFCWTSTDRFTQLVSTDSLEDYPPYVTNDIHFYNQLKSRNIRQGDADKVFTFIHLQGSHAPYVMNEKAEPVSPGSSNAVMQTKGAFHIIFEYIDQLKRLGVYESSTIIITGDHGSRKDDTDPLESPIVTALFVKPLESAGTPLASNHAPVSIEQFRPFIYCEAGLPYDGLGETYFEIPEDSDGVRYLYHRLIKTEKDPERLLIYEIRGDANQFKNWKLIEEHIISR